MARIEVYGGGVLGHIHFVWEEGGGREQRPSGRHKQQIKGHIAPAMELQCLPGWALAKHLFVRVQTDVKIAPGRGLAALMLLPPALELQ